MERGEGRKRARKKSGEEREVDRVKKEHSRRRRRTRRLKRLWALGGRESTKLVRREAAPGQGRPPGQAPRV